MRYLRFAFVIGIAALLFAGLVAPASAAATAYSFRLSGENTALAPVGDDHCAAGDWISLRGSGAFDVAAGTITASGTFVHYAADGTVHARGAWWATSFVSFRDFGGSGASRHGGALVLQVTHVHDGEVHSGLTMTVTSSIRAPAGTVAGSTVGAFTHPTGGNSVFAIL